MVELHTRVMVVEDDHDTRQTLDELFRLLGHQVTCFASGAAALAAFASVDPDVVFIDLGLPDIDGDEVAKRLRFLAGRHPILIFTLSGWSADAVVDKVFDAGVDLHLVKPVSYAVLRELVGDASADGGDASPTPTLESLRMRVNPAWDLEALRTWRLRRSRQPRR